MSKYIRPMIIAAAVLAVLCAAIAFMLVTAPENDAESGTLSGADMSSVYDLIEDDDNMSLVLGGNVDEFTEIVFTTPDGSYSLKREEDKWQVSGMGETAPDLDLTKRCAEWLAGLMGIETAHGVSGDDLEQFGLKEPSAEILFKLSDGEELTLSLGIMNPRKKDSIFCMVGDDGDVFSVDYGNIEPAFSDARYFAELVMNEDDGRLDSVYIARSGLEREFKIEYMSEFDGLPEDITVTSTNSYRFTSPVRAEIDSQRASALYLNLCGLRMDGCEYLEKSDENLKACGLDNPSVVVRFTYNGAERVLIFGNEFTKQTSDGAAQCFYAALDGAGGIFSMEKRRAVWCTFDLFDSISKRPLSPYIYGCESVEIVIPDGEYKFVVDEPNKWFLLDGKPVDSYGFRQLYSKLIGEVGDELYTEAAREEPVLAVKFNYTEKYAAVYGTSYDELSFSDSDGRRYAVTFNGNTLFKVNRLYVQGIIEDVSELVNN